MKSICLGVLGSTKGTDLQAIINAIESRQLNASIGLVMSNRKNAFILKRARKHHLPELFLDSKQFENHEAFDKTLAEKLKQRGVELVLLIGYNKILTPPLLNAFPNRILNIHPSLLPAFAESFDFDVHQSLLDRGVKVTGATLHIVTEKVDAGPIVLQKAVFIKENETAESLKQNVQKAEQELFLKAIPLFTEKKLKIIGKQVFFE